MKDEIRESMETSYQKLKDAQKLIKQVPIRCPHQYLGDSEHNGKQALIALKDGTNKVKCKRCGEVFSLKQWDLKDVSTSVEVLHDIINQIKVCTSPRNDEDRNLIEALGKQDFLNVDLITVYDRVINDYGNETKKKKKKKKRENGVGRYGSISL